MFSTGYLANLGVVTALGGPGTLMVSDAHVHASLIDACRLSRSRVEVVPHNDVEAVEATLLPSATQTARRGADRVGLLSVLGDAAPLVELAAVAARARRRTARRTRPTASA